jgi:D-glycero-D-manno-heptose 1,7-bisphosphate phosphatase
VARGYFDDDRVRAINAAIATRLGNDGVAVDAWYWCSHYGAGCDCRKPEPGMVYRAVADHALTLASSAVVGDRGSDIELARRAGMPGVLVPGPLPYAGPEPAYRAATLLDAAEWIVRHGD